MKKIILSSLLTGLFFSYLLPASGQQKKSVKSKQQQNSDDSVTEAKQWEKWKQDVAKGHAKFREETMNFVGKEYTDRTVLIQQIEDSIFSNAMFGYRLKKGYLGGAVKMKNLYNTKYDSIEIPLELIYSLITGRNFLDIKNMLQTYITRYPNPSFKLKQKVASGVTENYSVKLFARYDSMQVVKMIIICDSVYNYAVSKMEKLSMYNSLSNEEKTALINETDRQMQSLFAIIDYKVIIEESKQ